MIPEDAEMDVKKAVIPVAGLGTRFLPVTKSMPKEMLPIIDTPVIHYVVQEAIESGIDDIIFVTGRNKRAIEDYFDGCPELEMHLQNRGKYDMLEMVQEISSMVDIHYIRQKEPNGLGDAIMTARKHVSGDPFAVLLGDDIIVNDKPCTRQLIDVFQKYGRSTIAVEKVPQDKVSSYGIISGSPVDEYLYALDDIVEKPSVEEAPSNIGAIGRYVFTPEIFDCIEQTSKGVGGEIQLTDGIRLLNDSQKVYAHQFTGQRYDSGNKVEYVKAVLDFALKDEGMRDEILGHMEKLG
ncbi:UTP--glucose-1-phosphate uridylyltransferase [Methanohalophilus portucalensis]|uniref:UTP--glucose-1-phosphate uridylyltransferase n=3 Tax=Methanohalophilus TaxID=2175 RepID=A0A2D3C696_9EURY|nr:UTP--glucose-1-phosphate uridylyltransferase [Methanohalophilus portucalensis]